MPALPTGYRSLGVLFLFLVLCLAVCGRLCLAMVAVLSWYIQGKLKPLAGLGFVRSPACIASNLVRMFMCRRVSFSS
jgi:hypothetical protein